MNERAPDFLQARAFAPGIAQYILTVHPAVAFEYHYESPQGTARVIHLERGALESRGQEPTTVSSFRAGVFPGERATRGGFYASPDSIPLTAEAHLLVDGGAPGDSIVCRSLGSWNGLRVTLKLYRENDGGGIELILQEEIADAEEHSFRIP